MAVMPLKLEAARRQLVAGGVIAYPTEAVWGLGCDPQNPVAVAKLLAIKGRNVSKGLILVAASIEQFAPYLQGLDAARRATLDASWPGPVTWLVPDNGYAPAWIKGQHSSVALRVSAHKQVAALCVAFAGPLVSTSANPAGKPTARWPWQVQAQLWGLDYCLPGQVGSSDRPSEIRDLMSGNILRPG